MVYISNLIYILFWTPILLYRASVWLYWLQDKEYRFDRFSELLFSKDAFRKLLFGDSLVLLGAILLHLFFKVDQTFILGVIFFLDFKIVLTLMREGIRRPVFTNRALRISAVTCLLTFTGLFLFYFNLLAITSTFFVTELLFILSFFIGIYWTGKIARRVKEIEKLKAQKILSNVKPYVIGITGSYGKTTTKDFIYHLVSSYYPALKTEANQNTIFGITRRIIKYLQKQIKYFVVEMGAYKIGEIKEISDLVGPNMGVITGIEEQHLSLFGSFENILKAKFELIESLPKGGIALFNYANPECVNLAKNAKKSDKKLKVYGYGRLFSESNKDLENSVSYRILKTSVRGIDFEIYFERERFIFSTPVLGVHFIENLSGAILTARLLKVPWENISEACKTLTLPSATMDVKSLKNGVVIINDTHNSTPRSFKSAVLFSKHISGTKIVVTPGIIELGEKSTPIHTEIGKSFNSVFNKVIVTNKEPFDALRKGFASKEIELITDPHKLVRLIKEQVLVGKCLVLFEGRQSKIVMDYIDSLT